MLDKRKLNQIENDDWNNSNDSESEIVTVQKRVTKRSLLKNIDECKIDSKIAQESIWKKILPYHLNEDLAKLAILPRKFFEKYRNSGNIKNFKIFN